jgi:hypothetical protein
MGRTSMLGKAVLFPILGIVIAVSAFALLGVVDVSEGITETIFIIVVHGTIVSLFVADYYLRYEPDEE